MALTRAKEELVVFTEGGRESNYLNDIKGKMQLPPLDLKKYKPFKHEVSRLLVVIGNQEYRGGTPTMQIKGKLKAIGYRWQSVGLKGWVKEFNASLFSIDGLKSELWSHGASGLEVKIFDDQDQLQMQYFIDEGQWTCIQDKYGKA